MKKNTKKDIENAICYIKEYARGLKERSKSDVSKRLCYAINTIIEDYNELEQVEMERAESAKLIKLLLPLVFSSFHLDNHIVDIEVAAQIPAEYYARRINEHYLDEDSIGRMFYCAYMDYKALQINLESLEDEQKGIQMMREGAENIKDKNSEFYKMICKDISNAQERMEQTRSEIERLS